MGVVEFRVLSAASAPDVLSRFDSFAALAASPTADPAIGGFRFVRAKGARDSALLRRVVRWLARPLPLLLVGGFAIAVVARPASTPPPAAPSDADALARFAYAQPAIAPETRLRRARSGMGVVDERARLELAALIEATSGASPITTSALPPVPTTSMRAVLPSPAHLAAAPGALETLAEARPKLVRLAATAPAEDTLVDILPMVEIVTPAALEPAAIDGKPQIEPQMEPEAAPDVPPEVRHEVGPEAAPKHEAEPRSAAPRPRAASAPRPRKPRAKMSSKKKILRAPRWAQQMYDNPWQGSAFSYVR